ncbi:MAG: Fur family transcriptional regulator [Dehalococcoidia bacterium]
MRPSKNKLADSLRRNGYRVTPQREAVLNAIVDSNEHMTPAAIHHRAKEENHGVGLVTVYRTLDLLAGLGLICRVELGRQSRHYTLGPIQHHHHIVCSNCGVVGDITNCDISGLEERLSQETGFLVIDHQLEFSGLCQRCQRNRPLGINGRGENEEKAE